MNNVERESTFRYTFESFPHKKITKGLEHRARIHQDSPPPFRYKKKLSYKFLDTVSGSK